MNHQRDNIIDEPKKRCGHLPAYAWLLVFLFLTSFGIGGGVSWFVVKKHAENDTPNKGTTAKGNKPILTTQAPSFSPSSPAPTMGIGAVMDVLLNASLDPDRLSDPTTPEFKAAIFLANDPNLPSYNKDRMIQRYAMATVFYSLGGATWFRNENWLSYDVHECFWHQDKGSNFAMDGACFDDGENATIETLILSNNNLAGSLPRDLGLLSQLFVLSLRIGSNVEGSVIPSEVGLLTNLIAFELTGFHFGGSLPIEIFSLSELNLLRLDGNNFNGPIPSEIGNLRNLDVLALSSNDFGGSLPSEIGLLSSLTSLDLGLLPSLRGSIPTEFFSLRNLIVFSMKGCNLRRTIPSDIRMLTSLHTLLLSLNRFEGELPSEIGLLSQLTQLEINSNRFKGTIPTELGMLTRLEILFLKQNRFSGNAPDEVLALKGQLRKSDL